MAAEQTERQMISRQRAALFCKDCIAGVIHPKANLIDRRVAS